MSLDKYLKPRGSSPTPDAERLPGSDGERLRQKASRYSDYAGHPASPIETESVLPITEQTETHNIKTHNADYEVDTEEVPTSIPIPNTAKGNRFKSAPKRANPPKSLPSSGKASKKSVSVKGLTTTTGIKLVFVDEGMKAEYMQIAGYLMLYHRVKLTMTAYFCFLHQQATARQSDKQFMADLAHFITPPADHVTP
jgi:hypothetical protein